MKNFLKNNNLKLLPQTNNKQQQEGEWKNENQILDQELKQPPPKKIPKKSNSQIFSVFLGGVLVAKISKISKNI